MVEGQRQGCYLAHRELPVYHPWRIFDLAEREDRRFGRGEDGGTGVHPEHAHVGDRDRSAGQVGGRRLAGPRGRGQAAQSVREPGQRQCVGVLDVRHDQAPLGGGGDAQVHVMLDHDLLRVLVPGRVDHGVPHGREKQRVRHEQQG